ncbi:hypothetical protein PA598K_06169 [Paenibacillus sp. 598K]|uniref:phosphotransferase family protein n=1 Tax=Paenibacillus sp. 598K TaxID=1117987 RepID=UPI000FF97B9F|nr:phosphotransferase [Paenibacillus sp. 598K]GBF77612.1 hypothetical protein PA598K_06169 [Paenibacillus sp. 598K]
MEEKKLQELRSIGEGNTAVVYAWEERKALKLFREGYDEDAVAREYDNALAIRDLDFPKPIVYERVVLEERNGIVYERTEGESLLDWVMRTGDLAGCAEQMATVHRALLEQRVSGVADCKDFLRWAIGRAESVDEADREAALARVDRLADGDTLCHGDLHPANILLTERGPVIIDFMNICHGDRRYDIARSVYLMQYTPVPEGAGDRESVLRMREQLTDLYLERMGVTRDELADYFAIIRIARAGENPEEFQ